MHETEEDKQHRKLTDQQLSVESRKHFQQIEFDANEELVGEIRKHKFGLFVIVFIGALVVLTLLGISAAIANNGFIEWLGFGDVNSFQGVVTAVLFLLMLVSIVITGIAAFLFVSSVIFVTSEKVAQVYYVSLFHKKMSQLSIGDIQDVTVTKKGIFAYIFNYGTLVVETAGEQQNYTFTFVPDPFGVSKMIVGTHEKNLSQYGN